MYKNLKNIIVVIFVSLLALSCQPRQTFNDVRKDGLTALPKRSDSWFKKNIGKLNEFDKIDPYGNLSREDYMKLATTNHGSLDVNRDIVAPTLETAEFSDLVEEPKLQDLIEDKLVSISVNEDIPLKEVLIELARRAEVDCEIDKDINGSVIFIAKDKPFSEVIDRLAKIANLNYTIEDGVLKITKDRLAIKTYKFNILDITRNSTSSITSSFSVGGGGGEGGASVNSGSTSQLDIKSGDGDIWKGIEDGVKEIVSKYSQAEQIMGQAQVISQTPSVADTGGILSLNKKAGMVSVLANTKQHKAIKEFLDNVHISLTSQVLIEAKVLEVSLNDQYKSGVNWNLLSTDGQANNGIYLGSNLGGAATSSTGAIAKAGSDLLKFGVLPTELFGTNYSLDASVELLQTFGVTRSLSNPRISAMNNQFAVLNFSKNEVYFDIQLQEDQQQVADVNGNAPVPSFSLTSTIKTVPVGVVLGIQPSIDLERGEISMSVRPTLTRVKERISNPGVELIAGKLGVSVAGLNSEIPLVEVRELDTVFRVKSGQIMVIGGLLEERIANDDSGLPGFSAIPYIGNVFKKTEKEAETVETVIFMKATIVAGQGVTIEDENFYNKFTARKKTFVAE